MSVETIKQLMREVQDLRIKNAKLMDLAKKAQARQDYWRTRYYDVIHHKEDKTEDMPDFFKDLFK